MINKILEKYHRIPTAGKATLWFIFCSFLQKSMSVITTPIFTRMMSTEQYGQFNIYNSWLQIFTIFVTLRLNYAVFNKGMSKYKNDRDGYASTMQTLTFSIALAFLILYFIFRDPINKLTELPTFIMVAIFIELLFTPAIDFWTIRKRYEYIYKPVVIRTVLMTLLNAGLGIAVVTLSNEKGYARILSCVFVNLLFGVALFISNRKKGKVWFVKDYAKFALGFNIPLLMHYFSQYVLDQFDRIMIQKMVSISAAGLYGVAYNAGLLMKIITQSINNALIPWQYDKLEKRKFKELDSVVFLTYLIVAACAIIFSAFAPEIMRILADKRYYEAVYVIPPVALGLVFSFMYTTFANVELFFDQNKFTMYISMAGALLNILLNYIGIQLFGYVAAAYTTLICYVLFALTHYMYMTSSIKKTCKVERIFNTRRILLLSCGVLGAGVSIIFFYDKPIIRYSIIAVIIIILIINRDRIKRDISSIRSIKKK